MPGNPGPTKKTQDPQGRGRQVLRLCLVRVGLQARRKRGEEPSLGRGNAGLCSSLCQKLGFGDMVTCRRGKTRGLSPGMSRKGEHQPHCFHWPSFCLQVSPQLTCLPPLDHSGSDLQDFPPRESGCHGNLSKICLSRTLWFSYYSREPLSLWAGICTLSIHRATSLGSKSGCLTPGGPWCTLSVLPGLSFTHSHLARFSHFSGRECAIPLAQDMAGQ